MTDDLEIKDFEDEVEEEIFEEEIEIPFDDDYLTPLAEENRKVLLSRHYADIFYELYLELFDLEKSFVDSRQGYTDMLLRRGINANPENMYNTIELVLNRMTKILITKKLCQGLGLHLEADAIVEKEMDLLYRTPGGGKPAGLNQGKATGEK